jgi:hypothetical protein
MRDLDTGKLTVLKPCLNLSLDFVEGGSNALVLKIVMDKSVIGKVGVVECVRVVGELLEGADCVGFSGGDR